MIAFLRRLLGLREHCPAPVRVAHEGPVCQCSVLHHVVSDDDRLAVTAEWILARLREQRDLAVNLAGRLEDCPKPSAFEVTR